MIPITCYCFSNQYSTKLDKLFVSLDKACPIKFKVKNEHPGSFPQYQIRGQVVYSRPEGMFVSVFISFLVNC